MNREQARVKEICELHRRGQLIRSLPPETAEIWATTLRSFRRVPGSLFLMLLMTLFLIMAIYTFGTRSRQEGALDAMMNAKTLSF